MTTNLMTFAKFVLDSVSQSDDGSRGVVRNIRELGLMRASRLVDQRDIGK